MKTRLITLFIVLFVTASVAYCQGNEPEYYYLDNHYNTSKECNRDFNVNCIPWSRVSQDFPRSVRNSTVLMVVPDLNIAGRYLYKTCSGVLIRSFNPTDQSIYVLTAAHTFYKEYPTPGNSLEFIEDELKYVQVHFNFQTPGCAGEFDYYTHHDAEYFHVKGLELVASGSPLINATMDPDQIPVLEDWAVFKLTVTPPPDFGICTASHDFRTLSTDLQQPIVNKPWVFGDGAFFPFIHHPKGDVKKMIVNIPGASPIYHYWGSIEHPLVTDPAVTNNEVYEGNIISGEEIDPQFSGLAELGSSGSPLFSLQGDLYAIHTRSTNAICEDKQDIFLVPYYAIIEQIQEQIVNQNQTCADLGDLCNFDAVYWENEGALLAIDEKCYETFRSCFNGVQDGSETDIDCGCDDSIDPDCLTAPNDWARNRGCPDCLITSHDPIQYPAIISEIDESVLCWSTVQNAPVVDYKVNSYSAFTITWEKYDEVADQWNTTSDVSNADVTTLGPPFNITEYEATFDFNNGASIHTFPHYAVTESFLKTAQVSKASKKCISLSLTRPQQMQARTKRFAQAKRQPWAAVRQARAAQAIITTNGRQPPTASTGFLTRAPKTRPYGPKPTT